MADINLENKGDGRYELSGDLNFKTVPKLWKRSEHVLEHDNASDIEIDLKEVKRVDSAGIALLIEWLRIAREQDKNVQFTHIPDQMKAMVTVCDLDDILPVTS